MTESYKCMKCSKPLRLEHVRMAEARPEVDRLEFTVHCDCDPDGEPVVVRYRYNLRALRSLFGSVPKVPWRNKLVFVHNVDSKYADELKAFRNAWSEIQTPEDFFARCGGNGSGTDTVAA